MFADAPLVTVYVPARNYGRYLAQAVESVRAQLYPHWELYIIDEGSDDNTAGVAEQLRLQDPDRIRVLSNPRPEGLQRVANRILGLAKGRYIVRLDADDWLDEAALLLMVAKLESDPELGLVYGNYFYTDSAGKVNGVERRRSLGIEDASRHLPPHGACTMVRARALKAVGGYSESVDAQDGWDLWHKLLNRVKAANLEAPLFYYRQHQASLSRDESRLLDARRRILERVRQQLDGHYVPSCLAVVPARESYPGFEGVPYLKLEGRSLLQRAIESAAGAKAVTHVAVSTDSEEVLKFAAGLQEAGAIGPFMPMARASELSGSHIRLREILLHACHQYEERQGTLPDIVMFLSLHAPFRRPEHLDKAVDTLRIHTCDSVVSVSEEVDPVFTHGRDGLRLLNPGRFDDLALERERLYRFNGAVIALWSEVLMLGDLFGQRVGYIEMTKRDSAQVKSKADLDALAASKS